MPAISLVKQPPVSAFKLMGKEAPAPKLNRGIGVDLPSGGLVPIGDTGWWITPDEPADPRDCERYPNSAWCSYDFFTLTPFSFEPKIAIDLCNVGIRLDMSFGFYRLPPISLVRRDSREACRIPVPQEPVSYSNGSRVPYPNNICSENSQSLTIYWMSYTESNNSYVNIRDTGQSAYIRSRRTISIDNIEFPYRGTDHPVVTYNRQTWNPLIDNVVGRVHYTATIVTNMSKSYRTAIYRDNGDLNLTHTESGVFYVEGSHEKFNILGTGVTSFGNTTFGILGSTKEAKDYLEGIPVISSGINFDFPALNALYNTDISYEDEREQKSLKVNWDIKIVCGSDSNEKNPPLPRRYNPPPRRCCMSCCPSQGEQDNSLLALLIQKVDKLSSVVGVDDYPVSLPASLITKDEGFLGNLIPNENIGVPNLTRLAAWYIERFDEIMGQWEIPIEIKDSDPTKPGEQPVGIKLPNIAECMAEMFTLCFQTNINSETLLNICMRTLGETGTDKQQNFITYKLLQSLTDWVGYKQKDTVQTMPLSFTLNKTRYDEILRESEVDVPVPEFDEKFGLEADLMKFREATAILAANHKVKIDPNGDIKGQILKRLLDTFANINKINKEDDEEQKFEDFCEQVEEGFINVRGVENNTQPYDKPFNQRPRIKDLTNLETDSPEP